jgi:hypothetical protein
VTVVPAEEPEPDDPEPLLSEPEAVVPLLPDDPGVLLEYSAGGVLATWVPAVEVW